MPTKITTNDNETTTPTADNSIDLSEIEAQIDEDATPTQPTDQNEAELDELQAALEVVISTTNIAIDRLRADILHVTEDGRERELQAFRALWAARHAADVESYDATTQELRDALANAKAAAEGKAQQAIELMGLEGEAADEMLAKAISLSTTAQQTALNDHLANDPFRAVKYETRIGKSRASSTSTSTTSTPSVPGQNKHGESSFRDITIPASAFTKAQLTYVGSNPMFKMSPDLQTVTYHLKQRTNDGNVGFYLNKELHEIAELAEMPSLKRSEYIVSQRV